MHAIRLIKPAAQLRTYVRFYAQRNVRIYDAVVIHPLTARAAPVIEFLFGDRFEVLYNAPSLMRTSPRAVVVGAQTHFRGQLRLHGMVDCFVIMFQPTGLHRLFSIPMHELTDRDYEADSVLGTFVSQLEQQLRECRTLGERVRIADQFLLQRSLNACGFDRISSVASQILLCGGNVRIAALADEAGLSVRQLERGFIQQVGMRPKLYARIARFEAALDSKVRLSSKSWTEVAQEFEYCDQMHMIHDFEDFTGQTPTTTLRQTELLFRGQIEAMRSSGFLANANDDPRIVL
jgi:AraC-like DNA-binding protein